MTKSVLAGMIGLVLIGASVPVVAHLSEQSALERQERFAGNSGFDRRADAQVMHLDVASQGEADAIRRTVLSGWSRSADEDVVVERMADAEGREFYCVKLAER